MELVCHFALNFGVQMPKECGVLLRDCTWVVYKLVLKLPLLDKVSMLLYIAAACPKVLMLKHCMSPKFV